MMIFAEKYLDLMFCVLMADGIIEERERTLFYSMIDNAGINNELREKYIKMLDAGEQPDYDKVFSTIVKDTDVGQLSAMVKDAYLMSAIDENIDKTELDVINKFLKAAGIPESKFEEIQQWALEGIEHIVRGKSLFLV